MSSLAPSCTLAVDREKSSCETGCNSGSVATCELTSVNNVAVRSLISLSRIEGNPPLGQDKACSTEKMFRKHSVWECEVEASHNAGQGNLERQIYAAQNHIFIKGKSC